MGHDFASPALQWNSGCYCWRYSVLPDKADDDSRLHQAPLVRSRLRKPHPVEKVHRISQSRLQHLHSPSTCANQQKSHFPRPKLLTKLFTVLSAANVAILALSLQNTVCLLWNRKTALWTKLFRYGMSRCENTKNVFELARPWLCGFSSGAADILLTFPVNKLMFRQQLNGYTPSQAIYSLKSKRSYKPRI